MSVVCLDKTQAYGEKVLLSQISLLKRDDLTIVLPSHRAVALAINMAGINTTDKLMLISLGINHCYSGGNNSKEMLICGVILF